MADEERETPIAVYAEAGLLENSETGEVVAYVEVQELRSDGENWTLRVGMGTQEGLWFGFSILEKTLRAFMIRSYRKARGK